MTTTDQAALQTSTHMLTGADAIEQFLSNAYTSMRLRSDTDRPRLRYDRTDAGAFTLDTLEQTAAILDIRAAPLHTVAINRMATGRMQRTCGGVEQRYGPGDLYIATDPDQPYTVRWLPSELHSAALDPGLLARVAATAPGRRPAPLRFTSLDPTTPAAAAHWWDTYCYIAHTVHNPEAATPLVLGAAARLLAAVTLTTFANTALTDPTIEDRHDAHPDCLRRAIAFIDDNAHRDISAADIAAAAHVTIRTIQVAFRRHLDTTPTAHLRRVRLHHAHRDLQAADPTTTTVFAVASRWGFPNHSRFTASYHQTYGTTPSQTLRD
ncbi:helix-turn-helix domain-containing protein [Actinoplanes sp. CA-030573]|uniref:helix-turn-helix domain-containing protein n=1 Tax=Actinoplanes sp. CA-030573 TaxID=3239898 RepID=UPI003D8E9306